MKKEILVIIPHASRKRPKEIKKEWLSKNQRYLLYSKTAETDRYSELLYDFRKIIGNQQAIFPFSKVYLNICSNPKELDKYVPLKVADKNVYLDNKEPSKIFRRKLIQKYAIPFYRKLEKFKGKIILNAHTTLSGHSSLDKKLKHDIVLSNFIIINNKKRIFAPYKLIKIYSEEIKKRLPNIKIGFNSIYVNYYDYFCDKLGWKNGKGIPVIIQETNENLYIKNNKLNLKELNKLKKIFAESLKETTKRLYA